MGDELKARLAKKVEEKPDVTKSGLTPSEKYSQDTAQAQYDARQKEKGDRRRLSTLMDPMELTQRASNTADPDGQTFQELLSMTREIEAELLLMMSEYRKTVDGASEVIQSGKVSASLAAMGSVGTVSGTEFREKMRKLRMFKEVLKTAKDEVKSE